MRENRQPLRVGRTPGKERGVAAVEFALIATAFFMLFFGIVEVARAMYICNTLQEVTRRAAALAATADFADSAKMQHVREQAVFRDAPGALVLADPITDKHIKIDYMSIQNSGTSLTMAPIATGSMPSSTAVNYANCLRNPYGSDCVRLVRVRVCQPDGGADCTPVPYQTLVSLIVLPFNLPKSTTIVNAETLGMPEGTPTPCGCS
jgi:Flp pilus assembly protein TadG